MRVTCAADRFDAQVEQEQAAEMVNPISSSGGSTLNNSSEMSTIWRAGLMQPVR